MNLAMPRGVKVFRFFLGMRAPQGRRLRLFPSDRIFEKAISFRNDVRKGNVDKLAECLGISPRRVHGLVAEGVLPKPKRGMHKIGKCIKAYEQYRLECDKAYRLQKEAAQCQRDIDAGRPLRMSIELAAIEFGVTEERIRQGLRREGLL